MNIYAKLNTGEQHLGHHRRKTGEIQKRLDSVALVYSDKATAYTKNMVLIYICKKNKINKIRHGSRIKGKEVFEFFISS